MLKKFQRYIENGPWERFLEDDNRVLQVVCWTVLVVSAIWFVPTMVRIIVWGPGQ